VKSFLKSNFFLTKVLPSVFYSVLVILIVFPPSALAVGRDIVLILLLSVLLLNLYFKKHWISSVIGGITFFLALYLVFAVLSEYHDFPDGASFEALRLLIVGLILCFSSMFMSTLLCFPFILKQN
jgi:hypothetical protein